MEKLNIITVKSGTFVSYTPHNHYTTVVKDYEKYILGLTDEQYKALVNSDNGINGRGFNLGNDRDIFAIKRFGESGMNPIAPETKPYNFMKNPYTGFRLWVCQWDDATFEEAYLYNAELEKYNNSIE